MKTTRVIWLINQESSEFKGLEIYTTEAFKEEFGDGEWMVSFAKYGDKEDGRNLGSMDWNAFQLFFRENGGHIGLVHLHREADQDSVQAVFGMAQDMWVCPSTIIDIDK